MQLDFGFPRLQPAPRIVPARSSRSPSEIAREQFELYGIDRLQQHTFFYAIFADRDVTGTVSQIRSGIAARHGLAARFADTSRLHMSLLCLCKQSAQPLTTEAEHAATDAARFVRLEPFDIVLDRAITFGRPGAAAAKRPIVLKGSEDAGIRALHRGLFQVLERARIIGGRLRAFTPHMTLFYDNEAAVDEPVPQVRWTVREFHLVHSLHGKSQYRVLATFPLRG